MASAASSHALPLGKPGASTSRPVSAASESLNRLATPDRKKVSTREDVPLVRVRKERQEIDAIKHNNEVIRLDAIRGTRDAKINVKSGAAQVARLQDQAEMYFQRIQVEKRKIAELEEQMKVAQMKVLEQKQKMGGVNASKENDAMITKQIRILENRLDKTLVKFNQALAENKSLRERIDRLRMDRVVYDNVYKRLERCLHEKKKEMGQVIEDAKRVCVARDKAKSELAIMKQQAEKEKAEFEREWRELGRLIEEDRQTREAMKKKLESEHRGQRHQQQPRLAPPAAGGGSPSRSAGKTEDSLPSKKAPVSGGGGAAVGPASIITAKDKATASTSVASASAVTPTTDPLLSLSPEKLQLYEDAFAKVQEATGINDIDEMVNKLLEAEEKNFSLFNYVNELNNEIDQLELLIGENKVEMEKHKGQGSSADTQQKRLARVGEDRLQRIKTKADKYELKYSTATKTINQLKTGIHGIFSRLGCASTTPMEEMLGNQGVTESNMMQYLGFIEQRTIEILQLYSASQSGTTGYAGSAGILAPLTSSRITVEPPSLSLDKAPHGGDDMRAPFPALTGGYHGDANRAHDNAASATVDDDDDDDNDDRPLTRQELQKKALKRLTAGNTQPRNGIKALGSAPTGSGINKQSAGTAAHFK